MLNFFAVSQLNAGGGIFPVLNATLVVLRLLQPPHPPSQLFPTNHIRGEDMRACGRLWSGRTLPLTLSLKMAVCSSLFLHLTYARVRIYAVPCFGKQESVARPTFIAEICPLWEWECCVVSAAGYVVIRKCPPWRPSILISFY